MSALLFKRYVWLLDQISRGGMKYEDINNLWRNNYRLNERKEPLPVRTLQRHIKAIENMFGIEIECDRRDNNRYKVVGEGGGELSPRQETLIAHLRMSNAMMGDSELQGRIIMNQYDKFRWFTPLIDALQSGVAVEITYFAWDKDRMRGERDENIVIEPYFINQFDNWFLVGRTKEDGNLHAYEFKSIRNIEMTEERFEMPNGLDPMNYIIDPPYISNSVVANDDEMFLAERVSGIISRSRWGKPFSPSEGEIDYNKQELTNEKRAFEFKHQIIYSKKHSHPIFIDTPEEYEDISICLQNYTPNCEPYIRVSRYEPLIDAKISIEKCKCIECNRMGREHPKLLSQLISRVAKWLDEPCADSRFNGTNREYALWLWMLLDM